jgi:GTPase SAR1 family protein
MRDELKTLRAEFRETAIAARNVLDIKTSPAEGRVDSAAGRMVTPFLTILLVGGTQVGKSTLLNALAGDNISITGQGAATTQNAVFYTPEDVRENDLPLRPGVDRHNVHRSPRLLGKVVVDAPDCDSFMVENKARSIELLTSADVVMVVTSWEKYHQLSLHQFLQPEIRGRSQASFLFVVNKMDELSESDEEGVVESFREILVRDGVNNPTIFPISAFQALQERTTPAPASQWTTRFLRLENFLDGRLDRKIKDSNLAQEMTAGLSQVLEGGEEGPTVTALRDFLIAAESAEMELRQGVRRVLNEVLLNHQDNFLQTMRGIAGERMSGGFGTYLSALTYLRPSRLASLLPIPGARSPEQSLLDGVAQSMAARLSHRMVDGIQSYLRRVRSASKDLRDRVQLAEQTRKNLDGVGAEPMLSPDALLTRIRPGLESLTQLTVGKWTSRILNFPVYLLIHTAPFLLLYQYFGAIDPTRALFWILTLPFVFISLMEIQRMAYEGLWLRHAVRRRIKALTAGLEEVLMQALAEGCLSAPHAAQAAIRELIDRHRGLSERIALVASEQARG